MSDSAEVAFDGKLFHPDSVLAAAHVLARNLRIELADDGEGGTLAYVSPASGADTLRDEAAAQELRRRIAVETRPLRQFIVTQSLLAAGGERQASAAALSPAPNPVQISEIDRLIDEAEKEIEKKVSVFEAAGNSNPAGEDGGRIHSDPNKGKAP